jgi:hypothetical protein
MAAVRTSEVEVTLAPAVWQLNKICRAVLTFRLFTITEWKHTTNMRSNYGPHENYFRMLKAQNMAVARRLKS